MESSALRLRKNGQRLSGAKAMGSEHDFSTLFSTLFHNSEYTIEANPKEFKNVYGDFPVLERDEPHIYKPDREYTHGFVR